MCSATSFMEQQEESVQNGNNSISTVWRPVDRRNHIFEQTGFTTLLCLNHCQDDLPASFHRIDRLEPVFFSKSIPIQHEQTFWRSSTLMYDLQNYHSSSITWQSNPLPFVASGNPGLARLCLCDCWKIIGNGIDSRVIAMEMIWMQRYLLLWMFCLNERGKAETCLKWHCTTWKENRGG